MEGGHIEPFFSLAHPYGASDNVYRESRFILQYVFLSASVEVLGF